MDKLREIGIRDNAHKWFASYLENRKQYVEIQHLDHKSGEIHFVKSDVQAVKHSIPQGSCIGCLLFLIYINNLPRTLDELCILFADDISVLTSCQNDKDINETLHTILTKLTDWMKDHNLEINFLKTKIMQFKPYQKNALDINFSYNGVNVECVDTCTFLGLNIDTSINWKSHIQKTKSKLSKFIYALRELKKYTNFQCALTAYYAYAFSWLKYGVILWGNSTDINDLFILQKKCVRILANIKNIDSCRPYFIEYQILTLTSIYIFEICKFVRKYPQFFPKLVDQPRRYQTRFKNNLAPASRSNLKLHKTSPTVMAVSIFNKISDDIKQEETEKQFNRRLKDYLVHKCYYSLKDFFDDTM
jgi:hypothetical protein